jgi:hypothetical protein
VYTIRRRDVIILSIAATTTVPGRLVFTISLKRSTQNLAAQSMLRSTNVRYRPESGRR